MIEHPLIVLGIVGLGFVLTYLFFEPMELKEEHKER